MSEKLKSARESTKKRGTGVLPIAALAAVLYGWSKLMPTAEERLASDIRKAKEILYIPKSLSAEQQKEYEDYIHYFSATSVHVEMPQELLQQWWEVSGDWQRKLALYKYDKDVKSLNKIIRSFVSIQQFNTFINLARDWGIKENIFEETEYLNIHKEKTENNTWVGNFEVPEMNYYKLTQD